MSQQPIALIGEKQVNGARILALRAALRLEAAGFKRSRGRSVLGITRDMGLHNKRTARAALPEVNAWIAEHMGL